MMPPVQMNLLKASSTHDAQADFTRPLPERILRLSSLVFLAAVALSMFFSVTSEIDVWGMLATGRFIVENRSFPYQDPFSFTETRHPWIYHEWLTGVVWYVLYKHLSPVSLYLLKGLTGMLIGILLYRRLPRLTLPLTLFAGIAMGALGRGFSLRPQTFTYLLFVVTLSVLETARGSQRPALIYWLVPLMPLWANLHGGFVAGICMILLHGSDRRMRWHAPTAAALCFAATAVNPYGVSYWGYVWRAITRSRPEIAEWQSLWQTPASEPLLILLLIISSLWVGMNWRRYPPSQLLCLAVSAVMAVQHVRHAPFFAITALFYVPGTEWQSLGRLRLSRWAVWTISAVFLLVSLRSVVGAVFSYVDLRTGRFLWTQELNEMDFCHGAVTFIGANHITGNMVVTFEYGEYCIWKLYPQIRVSIDGRYETVYTERTIADYWRFARGQTGWETHLAGASYALLDPATPSAVMMRRLNGWRRIYEDGDAVLFQRLDPSPLRSSRSLRLSEAPG